MIYTIFFRKLQKIFGVAIQTMGYPKNQKVYTPHLDIGKVQAMNDNHYHGENENKNNNENENENDSKNASTNHFHFLGKWCKGYGVGQYRHNHKSFLSSIINHKRAPSAPQCPFCVFVWVLSCVVWVSDTIYWVWVCVIVQVSYWVWGIVSGYFIFLNFY